MSSAKYHRGISETADSVFDDEQQQDEVIVDDNSEEAVDANAESQLEIITSLFPLCGGRKPFSAMRRRLLPKLFEQPEELFDEFGFRLLTELDGSVDPTAEQIPLESSSYRMQWLALVQNTHSQVEDILTWAKVDIKRVQAVPVFDQMLLKDGIPHSLRPFLWPLLCGASTKRSKSPLSYAKIVCKSEKEGAASINVQIEKDLLRSLPNHYSFSKSHSPGIAPLKRVLSALAFLYPELGYCQGMGLVVGNLLLVCCEENAFWIMCASIEELLPPAYYSPSLLGVRVDERLLRHLVQVHMPELTELMHDLNADISMVVANWLITLLASAFPPRTLFRIWDWFFAFGNAVIFRIILAMLKLNEEKLLERWQNAKSSSSSDPGSELFAAISRLSSEISSVEDLLEMAHSFEFSVTDHLLQELRRKYLSIIMSGTQSTPMDVIIDHDDNNINEGSIKQKVTKRKLHRTTSVVRRIFHQQVHENNNDDENDEDPRRKNIRQTELLLDLRNAIIQICAHFSECNEKEHYDRQIYTQADYSLGFNAIKEQEIFFSSRNEIGGQRRARAIADFEQEDEHDLGFKLNDLIQIISTEDEHCWIGEIDGRRGWFPAKFVQLVGEHCKNYCVKGDEVLSPRIAELVRGAFAFSFRQILCHGIRKPSRHFGILSSSNATHPWSFIEAIANGLAGTKVAGSIGEKLGHTENSSRLTLSTTFRLDQDGRVLSPEELLLLAIHSINYSHDPANAPLDSKFRSLVVFGLNEQCLHLWFNIFCHSTGQDDLRKRFYHSWSFIRSPASQQICCELKLLMQFGFSFDVDSEIVCAEELRTSSTSKNDKRLSSSDENRLKEKGGGDNKKGFLGNGIPEGVRDLLVKHHLFSWDL